MSMMFYSPGWELAVDSPGSGELLITTVTDSTATGTVTDEKWYRAYYGSQVVQFLAAVTARALCDIAGRVGHEDLPAFLTPDVARGLLPTLQKAVLLTLAGSDRYERVFPDDGRAPAEPLCIRCHKGSFFPYLAISSEWCEQFGHRAFGTSLERWEEAHEAYRLNREGWKRTETRRRESRKSPQLRLPDASGGGEE
ncbi:hypothetical protein [Actinoplanes sp. NPDC051859]|uniref:hypothetical protein n=1 Tax=Actinoplanes sp. NPDC051859 TaxID=3363909 RepID=UPI0037991A3D